MSRFTFLFVLGLVCLCAMPLAAQDAVLGQLYGSGVHAYFGQDYVKAHQSLTSAIDGKTQDPRAYYFRGLAYLKMGRPQEAETDFKAGAKLESAIDPTRAYNIARALERVQGSDRATLEQFRLKARMTVLENAEKDHALRYQQSIKEQRDYLQSQSTVKPVETPTEGPKAPEVGPGAGPPADPFSTGEGGKAPEMKDPGGAKPAEAVVPPTAVEAPAEKPATKPEAKPAAENPFGPEPTGPAAGPAAVPTAPATGPAAPATAPKKPEAKPAGDDPFSAADAAAPAAPAKPAAPKKPEAKPAGDDPFNAEGGAAPATPAAPAAPTTPPAKKPAPAKPAEDDPFK